MEQTAQFVLHRGPSTLLPPPEPLEGLRVVELVASVQGDKLPRPVLVKFQYEPSAITDLMSEAV
eukprot:3712036-Amphidinium_carterae.1